MLQHPTHKITHIAQHRAACAFQLLLKYIAENPRSLIISLSLPSETENLKFGSTPALSVGQQCGPVCLHSLVCFWLHFSVKTLNSFHQNLVAQEQVTA